MPINRKDINSFLFALLYGIAFHLLQYFLFQRDMVVRFPGSEKLAIWDGGWYHSLAERDMNGLIMGAALQPSTHCSVLFGVSPVWVGGGYHLSISSCSPVVSLCFAVYIS